MDWLSERYFYRYLFIHPLFLKSRKNIFQYKPIKDIIRVSGESISNHIKQSSQKLNKKNSWTVELPEANEEILFQQWSLHRNETPLLSTARVPIRNRTECVDACYKSFLYLKGKRAFNGTISRQRIFHTILHKSVWICSKAMFYYHL